MKHLKISPEYQCSPLWTSEDGETYEHLEINDSPFDEDLKNKLFKWAEKFESTLNQDYPPDSGFASGCEEREFENQGLEIWKQISKGYSECFKNIIYNSYSLSKKYTDKELYKIELLYKFQV